MQPVQPDEQQKESRAALIRFAGLGMELAGGILGCLLLGWWVGRQFGGARAGLIVGAAIGCIGGMYNLIRQALVMQREFERQSSARHDEPSDEARPPGPPGT